MDTKPKPSSVGGEHQANPSIRSNSGRNLFLASGKNNPPAHPRFSSPFSSPCIFTSCRWSSEQETIAVTSQQSRGRGRRERQRQRQNNGNRDLRNAKRFILRYLVLPRSPQKQRSQAHAQVCYFRLTVNDRELYRPTGPFPPSIRSSHHLLPLLIRFLTTPNPCG